MTETLVQIYWQQKLNHYYTHESNTRSSTKPWCCCNSDMMKSVQKNKTKHLIFHFYSDKLKKWPNTLFEYFIFTVTNWKNGQTRFFKASRTSTTLPHHPLSQSFNLKQNPSVQAQRNEPTAQLYRLSGNAIKTRHDVTTVFNRLGEHPGCFKSVILWLQWLFSFPYLFNFGVSSTTCNNAEQTSKDAVLRNISAAWEKTYEWRQFVALIANECLKTQF